MGINARHVRMWQARATLLQSLPVVCPEQVRELLVAARQVSAPVERRLIVRRWQRTHGLDKAWLSYPLESILSRAVIEAGLDFVQHPSLWDDLLWVIPEFCGLEEQKQAVFAEWRAPRKPTRGSLSGSEWTRTLRDWGAEVRPRQAIDVDPTRECREDFLARADLHYTSRAHDLERRGWSTLHKRGDLRRDAEWVLRRYVLLDPPSVILPGQVETVQQQIKRFARLADLGTARPAKRTHARK
jgi:hypothetical protein